MRALKAANVPETCAGSCQSAFPSSSFGSKTPKSLTVETTEFVSHVSQAGGAAPHTERRSHTGSQSLCSEQACATWLTFHHPKQVTQLRLKSTVRHSPLPGTGGQRSPSAAQTTTSITTVLSSRSPSREAEGGLGDPPTTERPLD